MAVVNGIGASGRQRGGDPSRGQMQAALPDGRRFTGTYVPPTTSGCNDSDSPDWSSWSGPWVAIVGGKHLFVRADGVPFARRSSVGTQRMDDPASFRQMLGRLSRLSSPPTLGHAVYSATGVRDARSR